ncbi:nagb/rpia/CoA transferase-like protein [Mytilinidion resinicola]|uniref:Translation initiation factor eIF2B subunit alpha n=1 Tax=Mytilinidion resinicola TaxID=574789 RepID=A0A6A6Z7F3_9PEZI|nr:nagb/rpia/CoA transferase-like protein [Mytilinidion resinicola]KAF2816185.1 nagb/rpia/CoA transferase-like protein [Mytilinidion resinicola]
MATETPLPDEFDVVAVYHRLLANDHDLTMPVAAIEALVEAMATSSTQTVSETMRNLEKHTNTLKSSVANPISLSAGTDLFQRYLVTTLNRPSAGVASPSGAGDFDAIRNHLLSNGRLFAERAKASRNKIASFGRNLVRDGATVLTNGGSRVVAALLRSVAETGSVRFKVVYVLDSDADSQEGEWSGTAIVAMLRARGIPVATIPDSAVAYSLGKIDIVIVGAEGVVENGGIISRLGTYQIGLLAKAKQKPFYVVAESHKFVKLFPLNQYDLPIKQRILDFKVGKEGELVSTENESQGGYTVEDEGVDFSDSGVSEGKTRRKCSGSSEDPVDYTPPNLISGILTESGVLTPSAVSEELIKIWF